MLSVAAAAIGASTCENGHCDDAVNLIQVRAERVGAGDASHRDADPTLPEMLRMRSAAAKFEGKCLHANAWLQGFKGQKRKQKYSQGDQDAVLDSLFETMNLGSTNKFFAEFGFNTDGYAESGSGPNTQLMKEQGWTGLLMDGGHESIKDNLHKEFITRENIGELFDKYQVPADVDYVSIDIDSCDLQVYLGLMESKRYRPRVMTVEYNAMWSLDESKANRCVAADGERYSFKGDGLHGASLAAIAKAAHENGYKLVYVTKRLDAFLVREDLVCEDSEPPLETWRPITGLKAFPKQITHPATADDIARWVQEY